MKNNIRKMRLETYISTQAMAEGLHMPMQRVLDIEDGRDEFDMKSLISARNFLKTNSIEMFDLPIKGIKSPMAYDDSLLFDILVGGLLEACVLSRITPNNKNIGKWAVLAFRIIKNCDKTFALKLSNICGLTEAIVKDSQKDKLGPNKKQSPVADIDGKGGRK